MPIAILTALSIFWGWQFVLFWSGVFPLPQEGIATHLGLRLDNIWLTSLVPFAIGTLLAILIPSYRSSISDSTGSMVVSALALSAAILVLSLLQAGGYEVTVASSLLVGLGTSAFTLRFGYLLGQYKPSDVLMLTAVALVLGAVISLFTSSLAAPLRCFLMVVMPLAMARYCMQPKTSDAANATVPAGPSPLSGSSLTGGFYIAFLVIVALMGASIGLIRSSLGPDVASQGNVYVFNGMVALAGALLCVSQASMVKGLSSPFFAVVGVVVSGCAALTLLAQDPLFSFAIHTVSFSYFNGLFWMIAVGFSRGAADRAKTFAVIELAMQVGFIAGTAAGALPIVSPGPGSYGGYAALIAGYAVLLLSVILLSKLNAGGRTPLDSHEARLACQMVASEYALTKREAQILELLCEGCSRSSISQSLSVSEETVKTHISHIYAKLGLHSRQEIVELLTKVRL